MDYKNELSHEEALAMIDDLAEMKAPVLLFSGGEPLMRKDLMELVAYAAEKTIELHDKGVEIEILTTDNHADGIWLYNYIKENQPERAEEVKQLLGMHGGCSAGTKFGNVDPQGNVHPCQFWQDYTVGNVKDTPFSKLWNGDDPLLVELREKEKHLKGQCGRTRY